jgi:hypothetical protein
VQQLRCIENVTGKHWLVVHLTEQCWNQHTLFYDVVNCTSTHTILKLSEKGKGMRKKIPLHASTAEQGHACLRWNFWLFRKDGVASWNVVLCYLYVVLSIWLLADRKYWKATLSDFSVFNSFFSNRVWIIFKLQTQPFPCWFDVLNSTKFPCQGAG